MEYINSDFLSENLHLCRLPQNSTEAYNKLVCLCQLEQERDLAANRLLVRHLSKHRERLVKMFWAFRRKEAYR